MCWGFARRAVVATTTVTGVDRGYTIDATTGTYDVALTAATTLGDGFVFGVYNSGSGTVTVNPNGAETIRSPAGSAATLALSQGQGVLVMCDGAGFEVVASTGIAPTAGSVISGLTTGRIVDAASATTVETAATITTDQSLVLSSGTIQLNAETASRIVVTDVSKQLDTPAAITTAQSITASNISGSTSGANTGDVTLTAIGAVPNANGATLTSQALNLQPANASFGGVITTGAQTIAGDKTFTGDVLINKAGPIIECRASSGDASLSMTTAASGSGVGNGFLFQFENASLDAYLWNREAGGVNFGTSSTRRFYINSTGVVTFDNTTAATSAVAAAVNLAGGLAVAKNVVSAQMNGDGVAITATAAATTTLTAASAPTQIFTGTTTQTVQFPAANLFGAGIAVKILVINRSTGTVTPTRAGADTFVGGGTTDPILTTLQVQYVSDGVSVWYKLAV
jgi:hypothetical protein